VGPTHSQPRQMAMKHSAMPPRFDPEKGMTIFEPEAKGYGYWVGGHDVVFDPDDGKFYLFCRIRFA